MPTCHPLGGRDARSANEADGTSPGGLCETACNAPDAAGRKINATAGSPSSIQKTARQGLMTIRCLGEIFTTSSTQYLAWNNALLQPFFSASSLRLSVPPHLGVRRPVVTSNVSPLFSYKKLANSHHWLCHQPTREWKHLLGKTLGRNRRSDAGNAQRLRVGS